MPDHVLGHTTVELIAVEADLRNDHWQLSIRGRLHDLNQQSSQMSMHPICPVCTRVCGRLDELRDHIWEDHVVARHESAHYRAWRQAVTEAGEVLYRQLSCEGWVIKDVTQQSELACPSCAFRKDMHYVHSVDHVDHHLSMLADPETLRPYRREILKFCPGFIRCPGIWDDLSNITHVAGPA